MIIEIHVTGDELNALNKKVGGIHMPKPMTNEELLKSFSTDKLAEFLSVIDINRYDKQWWVEWLKQPHTIE